MTRRSSMASILLFSSALVACGDDDGGPGGGGDAGSSIDGGGTADGGGGGGSGYIEVSEAQLNFANVVGALATGDVRAFFLRGSTEPTAACPAASPNCYVVTVVFPEDTALGAVSCATEGVGVVVQATDNQVFTSSGGDCSFVLAAKGEVGAPLSITGLVVRAIAPNDGVLSITDGELTAFRGEDVAQ